MLPVIKKRNSANNGAPKVPSNECHTSTWHSHPWTLCRLERFHQLEVRPNHRAPPPPKLVQKIPGLVFTGLIILGGDKNQNGPWWDGKQGKAKNMQPKILWGFCECFLCIVQKDQQATVPESLHHQLSNS